MRRIDGFVQPFFLAVSLYGPRSGLFLGRQDVSLYVYTPFSKSNLLMTAFQGIRNSFPEMTDDRIRAFSL